MNKLETLLKLAELIDDDDPTPATMPVRSTCSGMCMIRFGYGR